MCFLKKALFLRLANLIFLAFSTHTWMLLVLIHKTCKEGRWHVLYQTRTVAGAKEIGWFIKGFSLKTSIFYFSVHLSLVSTKGWSGIPGPNSKLLPYIPRWGCRVEGAKETTGFYPQPSQGRNIVFKKSFFVKVELGQALLVPPKLCALKTLDWGSNIQSPTWST